MKTIYDVICDLDTLENYLIVIRNALAGQSPEVGAVGPAAWTDIFSDLCDRLQDCKEALDTIRKEQKA